MNKYDSLANDNQLYFLIERFKQEQSFENYEDVIKVLSSSSVYIAFKPRLHNNRPVQVVHSPIDRYIENKSMDLLMVDIQDKLMLPVFTNLQQLDGLTNLCLIEITVCDLHEFTQRVNVKDVILNPNDTYLHLKSETLKYLEEYQKQSIRLYS